MITRIVINIDPNTSVLLDGDEEDNLIVALSTTVQNFGLDPLNFDLEQV